METPDTNCWCLILISRSFTTYEMTDAGMKLMPMEKMKAAMKPVTVYPTDCTRRGNTNGELMTVMEASLLVVAMRNIA
jgi:hypothetical protein